MVEPKAKKAYKEAALSFALAEQVRQIREDKGLSQAELAEGMGTTQSAVARLEAGGTSPTIPTLRKLADALGVELVLRFHDPQSSAKVKRRRVGAAKAGGIRRAGTARKRGKTSTSRKSAGRGKSASAKDAGTKR